MPNFKPTYFCQNCGKQNDWKGYSYENKYCNNACQQEAQRKKKAQNWLETGTFGTASSNLSNTRVHGGLLSSNTIASGALSEAQSYLSAPAMYAATAMPSVSPSTMPNWIKGETGYIAQVRGYACAQCGLKDWRNEKITLIPDHIDGNTKNNVEENIRLLCPNCKSQIASTRKKKSTRSKS